MRENILVNDTELPNLVELKKVTQTYETPKGPLTVIKNLDFLVEKKPQGQVITIVGLSGSGKSTLLRYIAGLQKPTSGEVLLNEKSRDGQPAVAMVFQKYSSLPNLSVLDNVMLPLQIRNVPAKEARDRAMTMIERVGLLGHEHKFAQDNILSGGQLQRVAIARSLVYHPELLLMDEPFSGLDIVTKYVMMELITQLWEEHKMTIIFVTHDPGQAVFLGDEVNVVAPSPGRIVDRIPIDLPVLGRNYDTMKTARYVELVNQVTDALHRTPADAQF